MRLPKWFAGLLLASTAAPLSATEIALRDLVKNVEAVTEDGRIAGHVQDVLLDREGRMLAVLVDSSLVGDSPGNDRSPGDGLYQELHELGIADVRFEAETAQLLLRGPAANEMNRVATSDVSLLPMGQVRAGELLELPVNLVGERNAGTVQDVVVNFEAERATGIVVETGWLFTSTRYLFPPELNAYDREAQVLDFAIQESELDALPEIPE